MAFDMYLPDRHEAIGDRDEFLFSLASHSPGDFPGLVQLQQRFYSRFVLSPEDAGTLVHELLDLYDRNRESSGKAIAGTILRLASFFSSALRSGQAVRCAGD